MGLYLTNVIELPSDFILVGEFRQGNELPGAIVHGISEWPEITDAQGRTLPFETPSDLDSGSNEMGVFPWAYQVPKGFASPLTITLQAVAVEYFVDLTFQFDAGSDPVPGQTWALDQTMELAGYKLHLVQASRQERGYEFTFESDPSVQMVSVDDEVHHPLGGGGGGYGGEVIAIIEYAPPVPSGILEYHIRRLVARYEGPWTLTWEAPEGTAGVGDLEIPEACLDLETWQRITESPPQLPGSLSGRLLLYGPIESEQAGLAPGDYGVYVVDLPSGNRQVLGPGTWPALSPDGSRVIYSWSDGLYLHDLVTGQSGLIPGTLGSDYNPRWSPDGSEIAFVRSADFNLFIMDAEGSNIRRVTEGREYEQLVGWMPTGHTLIYAFQSGEDEMRLRFLDLDAGSVEEGFVFDKSKAGDAAISPDGRQIAYTASIRGMLGYGLFIANIDGSEPRLLAQSDHWSISAPVWSPSADWLMVNVTNDNRPNPDIGLALIDPETCEAFPLTGIEGHLFGWSH
jgi:hypothetical protein